MPLIYLIVSELFPFSSSSLIFLRRSFKYANCIGVLSSAMWYFRYGPAANLVLFLRISNTKCELCKHTFIGLGFSDDVFFPRRRTAIGSIFVGESTTELIIELQFSLSSSSVFSGMPNITKLEERFRRSTDSAIICSLISSVTEFLAFITCFSRAFSRSRKLVFNSETRAKRVPSLSSRSKQAQQKTLQYFELNIRIRATSSVGKSRQLRCSFSLQLSHVVTGSDKNIAFYNWGRYHSYFRNK